MLKADFNNRSLERKLLKLGKAYGEGKKQAVKRWGVMLCKQLAEQSAIPKASKKDKAKNYKNLLQVDFRKTVVVYNKKVGKAKKGESVKLLYEKNNTVKWVPQKDFISSPEELLSWVDRHRGGRNKEVEAFLGYKRKVVLKSTFNKALKIRYKASSGKVKDGWLDAGDRIGILQKGPNRVAIGKNVYKFLRKPEKLGGAREFGSTFKPAAFLTNKNEYAFKSNVLSRAKTANSINLSLSFTIKWYKNTIRAENKKVKK